MEEKNGNNAGDMEFLDVEPEIKEFIRKSDAQTKRTRKIDEKKTLQRKRRKRQGGSKEPLWLIGAACISLAVLLCGIFLLKLPVITVVLVIILELILSACLCRSPIWLHGLILLLQIVLGILFHMPLFMLLACAVYLAGIWVLHIWGDR